jgi:hypothetical protein
MPVGLWVMGRSTNSCSASGEKKKCIYIHSAFSRISYDVYYINMLIADGGGAGGAAAGNGGKKRALRGLRVDLSTLGVYRKAFSDVLSLALIYLSIAATLGVYR